ncbi:uncharacterized protein CC84DRAFT_1177095 [Paraphaeosphaeria sporulosa]|uniref:Uncharacterized protein n=1 Tax=Paraphaeosphaeria sporulosa TaxID=1460663 RepID=A0A177CDY2_9PLEO|nr:uncharacterized protein CC84DRAFT_1177095 [Paraphaeosphaeria sporulosa]OAG04967.1 hypothetical protein CC84DRAFT_1177095 [Paraphaeosphaeria sporulosa]
MPDSQQLQHRKDGGPSTIDQWNKSIAIPGPIRGLNTPTTKNAVQKAKTNSSAPTAAMRSSSSPEILLNGSDDVRRSLNRPTFEDLREAAPTAHVVLSAAQTVTTSTLNFALHHPNFMKRYAFPFALNVFSRPLISLFPLGPLGPILAFVAVACGRFRLRQELMGGGYAALHAVGMAGVKGQALSLLGLVGLEATGSKRLRDTFNALMESNVGLRTQVIGLAIATVSTSTGALGSLGSMLGARAMSLLFKELRSFATFYGLKWAATNLQTLWRMFCTSSAVVKSSFLSYVLQRKEDGSAPEGKARVDDDAKRMRWVRSTLEQIATRIPQFPVEAVTPKLAAVLKAWDLEKESGETSGEAIDEWIEIDADDESSIWGDVEQKKRKDKVAKTPNTAAFASAGRLSVEDFSHRRSRAENAGFLEQVAREAFVKSGMSEDITARLAKMGFGAGQPWSMEVEEVDSDVDEYNDGIEVVDLGHT